VILDRAKVGAKGKRLASFRLKGLVEMAVMKIPNSTKRAFRKKFRA
jgi:hypothetical protein